MSHSFDVLWLNASPSLRHFDQPLLRYLAQHLDIARWEYCQSKDEASSLDGAVALLHEYLQDHDRPIHLAGHGISGVIGLMYARRYPDFVQSLTLLAVGEQPATTWHAHYYVQRQLLPCSQQQLLAHTARSLLGNRLPYAVKDLITAFNRDLEESPSMHSLFRLSSLPKGGISVPLMVCGSKTDPIVNSSAMNEWNTWLKPQDQQCEFSDGRHFFHYFYPEQVGEEILGFWRSRSARPLTLVQQLPD